MVDPFRGLEDAGHPSREDDSFLQELEGAGNPGRVLMVGSVRELEEAGPSR